MISNDRQNETFPCDRCGLCCRHIGGIELFKDMDDGTGVCRFLDRKTNLCMIYASRPLFCNVDAAYEVLFKENLMRDEFYELNRLACERLKEKARET